MVLLEDLADTPFMHIGHITLRSGLSHSCGFGDLICQIITVSSRRIIDQKYYRYV